MVDKVIVDDVNLAEEVVKLKQSNEELQKAKEDEEKKRKEAEIALVNFRPAPVDVVLEEPRVYAKKLKELGGNNPVTNREFLDTSIKFRESTLLKYGKDVWSDNGQPTSTTKAVASTIQSLLDECPTDEEFRYKLNMALQDDPNVVKLLASKRK